MKAEYDFSKGERGKFYDPKAVFNLPVYLEKDVDKFVRKLSDEKGKDVEELVNEWLRSNMQLTLKEHIDDICDRLEKGVFIGENAISQGIVLRLLRALNWPIFNTQIVRPEYSVEGGKVDFALCDPKLTPRVFIEVKKVGKIEGAEQQLFKYAFHHGGIPIALLTDGQKWRFFYQMGQEDYRKEKVRELDFVQDNGEEIADCLNRYLNYESICMEKAVEAIKADYERGYPQRQVARYLENNAVFNEVARTVAYMRWGLGNQRPVPWENLKEMLRLTHFSLKSIRASDVYVECVKLLMLNTRTAEQFGKWITSFKKDMSKTFGRRMGIEPTEVKKMVNEVIEKHNSTTR